jgi:hypothetical protein
MWCDYYIEKKIYIYYNDNTSYFISVNKKRGYYTDDNDFIMNTNIENSNLTEWEKVKQYHLTPSITPLIIYNNHSFTNIYVSNEYKALLEYEMIYDDIKDIVILEERYES